MPKVLLIDHGHVVICRSADLRIGAYFVHKLHSVAPSGPWTASTPPTVPLNLSPDEQDLDDDGGANRYQFSPVRSSYSDEAVGPGFCDVPGLARSYRLFGLFNE